MLLCVTRWISPRVKFGVRSLVCGVKTWSCTNYLYTGYVMNGSSGIRTDLIPIVCILVMPWIDPPAYIQILTFICTLVMSWMHPPACVGGTRVAYQRRATPLLHLSWSLTRRGVHPYRATLQEASFPYCCTYSVMLGFRRLLFPHCCCFFLFLFHLLVVCLWERALGRVIKTGVLSLVSGYLVNIQLKITNWNRNIIRK